MQLQSYHELEPLSRDQTMTTVYTSFIGVDVASRKLDLHDSLKGKHQTIQNSNDAIEAFVKKLSGRKGKSLVVMEATGGYEQPLVDALHDAQIDVAVCNPLQVRSFAKG